MAPVETCLHDSGIDCDFVLILHFHGGVDAADGMQLLCLDAIWILWMPPLSCGSCA